MTEIPDIEKSIATIARLAPAVGAAAEDSDAAREEQAEAEIVLLERVIALARPGLRAVASRPKECEDWVDDDDDPSGEPRTARASWAGLCLTGRPGPTEERTRTPGGQDRTSGPYGGTDLFLLPDGTFRSLTYSGTWSRWQDATCRWTSEDEVETVAAVIRDAWTPSLSVIVARIAEALEADARGGREKRAKTTRERAERIRALVTLL